MSTLPTGTAAQAVIDAARSLICEPRTNSAVDLIAVDLQRIDALRRALEAYETNAAALGAPADKSRADALTDKRIDDAWVSSEGGLRRFVQLLFAASPVEQHEAAPRTTADDYEEVLADHRRLVRELDVLLNGEAGAARQASLCDIVAQVRREKGQQEPLGADLPRFPVELRKMWSGTEVQRWIDERMKPRFKVLRNALEHIAKVSRGSREQSRRNRWIELRALGALNGSDEWRTVNLPKNGEGVQRRLQHEIAELQAVKQELQKALAYWMPKVFDERSAHDAYLLVGYEGETEESWGEKVQAELDRLNTIINTPRMDSLGFGRRMLAATTGAIITSDERAMESGVPYQWRDTGPLETEEGQP